MSMNTKNASPTLQRAMDYAYRRLYWARRVRRGDIVQAVGCSTNYAEHALTCLLQTHPRDLVREGQYVRLAGKAIPEQVQRFGKETLGELLLRLPRDDIESTGIKAGADVACHIVSFHVDAQAQLSELAQSHLNAILECLMRYRLVGNAAAHQQALNILYVSMARGESARWRNVIPLGLEQLNGQWRMVAHDMDKDTFPIKTYVLSRILETNQNKLPSIPKAFVRGDLVQSAHRITFALNPQLTNDQMRVVLVEIGAKQDGTEGPGRYHIEQPPRLAREFMGRFSGERDGRLSASAIWPLVVDVKGL